MKKSDQNRGNVTDTNPRFTKVDMIHIYTRRQAIEDGEQVLLEGEHAEMARQAGFIYPLYLTKGVSHIIEQAVSHKKHGNDFEGVLWDILSMARHYGEWLDKRTRRFKVIITGVGRRKYHTLLIQCGPKDFDDPTPVLTVMLPEEK